MSDVDDAILSLLAGDELNTGEFGPIKVVIWDGEQHPFPIDQASGKAVVSYNLPYAVYASNVGLPFNRRLGGRTTRNSTFWALTYVGESPEQTRWAGQQIRDALEGRRLVLDGRKVSLIEVEDSPRIWRSDDAIRADGSPLYYGVDTYAMHITTRPALVGGP